MSTQTPNYQFYMPTPNGDEGQWGQLLNSNWLLLDSLLKDLAAERSKSIFIEDPGGTEDITFFYTHEDITITRLKSVISPGSVTLDWTLRFSSNRAGAGTEVVVGGWTSTTIGGDVDITTFENPVIPAGSFIWIETTGVTGTPESFGLTAFFQETV